MGTRNGETVKVFMEGVVCANCGYKTVEANRMGEFALKVSDAYREAHGLLTSEDIRHRRHRLKMSQSQFARHLGVGVASVKRWELGQIQDEAMNTLIVLKTDSEAAERNYQEVLQLNAERNQWVGEWAGTFTVQIGIDREFTQLFWPAPTTKTGLYEKVETPQPVPGEYVC